MDYVLDACALIAFLNDEPEADTVADLLKKADSGIDRLFISSIQVLEIYYDRIYIKGHEYADTFLESIRTSSIVVLSEISSDVIREDSRLHIPCLLLIPLLLQPLKFWALYLLQKTMK